MLVPGDAGERAVVTDFGVARAIARTSEPADATEKGLMIGTPAYMAPEQVRGETAGPPADLYAFGVVLYEMVTGSLPFRADRSRAEAILRLHQDPPSPRELVADLDPRWEGAIRRCLEREPRQRFERASEVVAELLGEVAPGPVRPAARSVLPAERDAFFGREEELADIGARLDGSIRVLTLLGPGGIGKTRLAVRFGWASRELWPGGVFFCDLTETRSLESVCSAVAAALDVPLGKDDPVVKLGHAIAGRGRAELRAGDAAAAGAMLAEAESHAAAIGAGPGSELGRKLAALRRS